MESNVFCSVCPKRLDFKKIMYRFERHKTSAFVCSHECKQFPQYSIGFSHGILLHLVLRKLCPNLSVSIDKVCFPVPLPVLGYNVSSSASGPLRQSTSCNQCDQCYKTFVFVACLGSHRYRFERNRISFERSRTSAFVCSLECKQFSQYLVGFAHGIILYQVLCKLCPNLLLLIEGKFLFPASLLKRTSCKQFLCDHCNKSYGSMSSLSVHRSKKHGIVIKRRRTSETINCSKCEIRFTTLVFLNRHRRKIHGLCSLKKAAYLAKEKRREKTRNKRILCHSKVSSSAPKPEATLCNQFEFDRCHKSFPCMSARDLHCLEKHACGVESEASTTTDSGCTCSMCKVKSNATISLAETKKSGKVRIQKIPCEECGKKFSPFSLGRHMKTFQGAKEPQHMRCHTSSVCDICGKKYSSLTGLHHHKKTHNHTKPFVCTVCDAAFFWKPSYDQHLKTHWGSLPSYADIKKAISSPLGKESENVMNKRIPCKECGKTFSPLSLPMHMKIFHGRKEPVKCEVCHKTLNNTYHLREHMVCHTSSVCHICGNKYTSRKGLVVHMKTHNQTKSFVCEVCGAAFYWNTSYKRHLKTHSGSLPTYACDSCPKAFSTDYTRNAHSLKHHHRGKFFTNRLKTLEEVGYQVNKEHVDRHLNLQCVMCGEKLVNGTCIAHPLTCLLSFPCNHCEAVLNHVDSLCQHLKEHNVPLVYTSSTKNYFSASSGKRDETNVKFSCKVCDKSFKARLYVANHERLHTEKLLACHICFKKFTFKSSLRSHLKNSHSDKKPFQ